jgi:mono/diheme cytochrome c family protein
MIRNTVILLILALALAACGTVATPEFAASVQETRAALAATAAEETAQAPTATPTDLPTATPLPATEIPTEVPTDAPTEAPTAVPTDAPTEAPANTAADGPDGDPAAGETIFTTFYAEANFACNTCHLVNSEAQLIGPGLLNVSTRAEDRVPGESAEEYIRNSILHPSDFVVSGFPDMLMPHVYPDVLSDADLDNLVAYLFTLKG